MGNTQYNQTVRLTICMKEMLSNIETEFSSPNVFLSIFHTFWDPLLYIFMIDGFSLHIWGHMKSSEQRCVKQSAKDSLHLRPVLSVAQAILIYKLLWGIIKTLNILLADIHTYLKWAHIQRGSKLCYLKR